MEQLYTTEIIDNGREIVLSYGGPEPREVVLTYQADLPPAMCPQDWDGEEGQTCGDLITNP